MSETVTIRNKRDVEVEIPDVGFVEPGGTIDVPAALANGTPAVGTARLEDGSFDPTAEGYHAGTSGLLAQEDAWEKASPKRKSTDDAPLGEEV